MKWTLLTWAFLALAIFANTQGAFIEGIIAFCLFWFLWMVEKDVEGEKEQTDEQE